MLDDLEDLVVIAGPNGSGKSCVFDAIRLLKSAYGGYQPNEWQSWFGEFQINFQRNQTEVSSVLQDQTRSLEIEAQFVLAPEELRFLEREAESLLTMQAWQQVAPGDNRRSGGALPVAAQHRTYAPQVKQLVDAALPPFRLELQKPVHDLRLEIKSDGSLNTSPSRVLEMVFSLYDPQNIGIIDYHGSNRNYAREQVGGINLNIQSSEDRLRQNALYNSVNKYQNLKTEIAAGYVRHILAARADPTLEVDDKLTETLRELFSTFFPGKEFLGPKPTPDGRLLFPVRIANGAEHDIDDLSSGEKEVLYGYLRLRNAAPRNSILLIDEPELHLNPRLVSGLASFYHRHLGRELGSQIWLVSHSDTLIREAVGQKGFSVYHMQPPGLQPGPNQASPVVANEDLERVVIDLVGDLAAYRPGGKIVVFEGGGDSEFDVRMTCALFPKFQVAVNTLSGGNKKRVADLYDLLDQARSAGHLKVKFYSINDSDGEERPTPGMPRKLQWDVYHIENYLLEPSYIANVLRDLNGLVPPVATEEAILESLRDCAKETISELVAHQLRLTANKILVSCINLGIDRTRKDVAAAISEAATRSNNRIQEAVGSHLALASLEGEARDLDKAARAQLQSGDWIRKFRGRDVLKRFVGRHGKGQRYDAFCNLIIARMRDKEYQPKGMRLVVEQILSDSGPP